MTFLVSQISLFLLLAAIPSFIIGWFSRGHFLSNDVDQEEIDELKTKLSDREKRLKKLESETKRLKKQTADSSASTNQGSKRKTTSVTKAKSTSRSSSTKQKSTKKTPVTKAKSKSTTKRAKPKPDDLKQISGIGASIENILNEADITTFADVVKLNVNRKGSIPDELQSFADRIEHDDWAKQARVLHKEKYGKNP